VIRFYNVHGFALVFFWYFLFMCCAKLFRSLTITNIILYSLVSDLGIPHLWLNNLTHAHAYMVTCCKLGIILALSQQHLSIILHSEIIDYHAVVWTFILISIY